MTDKKRTVRKCKAIRDQIYDTTLFKNAVLKEKISALLSSETTMLDIGCGRNADFLRIFSPQLKKAYGIDLEVPMTCIDGNVELICGDAQVLPLSNNSVNIITMIDVAEHLSDPGKVFLECRRVLKPGGSFILVAPCKFYPPILFGRLLPLMLRKIINRIVTRTKNEDTFPTYYRANSARDLSRLAQAAELDTVCIEYLLYHPLYCMFSTFVYRFTAAIERAVLARDVFAFMRHQIFCHLKKP